MRSEAGGMELVPVVAGMPGLRTLNIDYHLFVRIKALMGDAAPADVGVFLDGEQPHHRSLEEAVGVS